MSTSNGIQGVWKPNKFHGGKIALVMQEISRIKTEEMNMLRNTKGV